MVTMVTSSPQPGGVLVDVVYIEHGIALFEIFGEFISIDGLVGVHHQDGAGDMQAFLYFLMAFVYGPCPAEAHGDGYGRFPFKL